MYLTLISFLIKRCCFLLIDRIWRRLWYFVLSQRLTPASQDFSPTHHHDVAFTGQLLVESRTWAAKSEAVYTMTICLPSLFIFIFESISKNIYLFIYYKDVNLPLSDFSLATAFGKPRNFQTLIQLNIN